LGTLNRRYLPNWGKSNFGGSFNKKGETGKIFGFTGEIGSHTGGGKSPPFGDFGEKYFAETLVGHIKLGGADNHARGLHTSFQARGDFFSPPSKQ